MMTCKQIKKLIDEADRPDVLSLEAVGHAASCESCREFAGERAKLRELLASGARVGVPVNFDATLRARLAAAAERKSFSWLSPAGYLRLGAASAVLVIAILTAQYNGLIFNPGEAVRTDVAAVDAGATAPANAGTVATAPAPRASKSAADDASHRFVAHKQSPSVASSRGLRGDERRVRAAQEVATDVRREVRAADGAVLLVRGRDGDLEVPVPTVSVGAQPLVYVNAGGQAPRNGRASF